MAKHSVDVLIKARDEASKKFGVVAASATVMGRALKGAASIAKSTLSAAFRTAKRAAMGLGAAFVYCTYKAIKQEAAEIELASALKIVGEYSEEQMEKLKAEAAAIQDATKYGDEYTLGLMRMAITLGATADKAGEAAKAAIALFEGFGGGRGKPAIFLRYYMDALRGTGSSLASYVGELRKAKTEEEKQIILQDALARGWDVAKSKTESAGGALSQMWNKLGDITEVIGRPFLSSVTNAAQAVKNWAKENESAIAVWAKKLHSSVMFAKDVMWDFVKFMREDWRRGMKFVLDAFLKMLKTTFQTAVILSIAGGKGIWKGIKEGLLGGKEAAIGKEIARITEEWYKTRGTRFFKYEELRKEAEKRILERKTESILEESLSAVTNAWKETFKAIWKDMPSELRAETKQAWAKHLQRLKGITVPEAGGVPGEAGAPGTFALGDTMQALVAGMRRQLQAQETRFLTFGAGTRFDYVRQLARDTKEQTRLEKQELRELKDISGQLRQALQRNQGAPELQVTAFT